MPDRPAPPDDFSAALERASVSALWLRDVYPPRREAPRLWRWADMQPLLAEALRQTRTGSAGAERRVLTLVNHAVFGPADFVTTTTNLSANMQVLAAGETAPPHRHSMNALRFVIEGHGAETIVDGKPCAMEPGDMVLTPAWTWHAHANRGRETVVWLDVLDAPLVKHLGAVRFERPPLPDLPPLPDDAAFAAPGLLPEGTGAPPHSPLFRYPWRTAAAALAAAPPGADGARGLRYVNVATGGPPLNLVACSLLAPAPGRPTRAYRSTSSAVCFVAAGRGRSRIGEEAIAWTRNDIFTLPQAHWIAHEAAEAATLFIASDREILRRLDLLADEVAA